jgi:DNA invertase Pin-like site-specific DNA recombinase
MEPSSSPQRMLAYLRVSTDEQAMSGLGLDGQRAALERAFAYRGWELVDTIRDEGISGSTLERPGLMRALEMLVAGDADGLVVAKLDRLSRSMRDFCELIEWFEEAERALVMLEPDVDTSTPAGRAVAHVMVAFAELERGMIADRTRAALAAARARRQGRIAVRRRPPELAERIRELRAPAACR